MTGTEIGLCVSLGLFAIAAVTAIVKIVRDSSDRDAALRRDIAAGDLKVSERLHAHEEAVAEQLLDQEREMRSQVESARQAIGEQGHALRTHIQHLEVWVRDKLVSKDDFELVTGRLEKSIERLGVQVENLPDRLIKRIDERRPAS